jgi:hypothetical protein
MVPGTKARQQGSFSTLSAFSSICVVLFLFFRTLEQQILPFPCIFVAFSSSQQLFSRPRGNTFRLFIHFCCFNSPGTIRDPLCIKKHLSRGVFISQFVHGARHQIRSCFGRTAVMHLLGCMAEMYLQDCMAVLYLLGCKAVLCQPVCNLYLSMT